MIVLQIWDELERIEKNNAQKRYRIRIKKFGLLYRDIGKPGQSFTEFLKEQRQEEKEEKKLIRLNAFEQGKDETNEEFKRRFGHKIVQE